jgi:hypothetical protein
MSSTFSEGGKSVRIMIGVTLLYGLGLAAASAWNALGGKPIKLSYLIVFGLIFLGSLAVRRVDRLTHQPALAR